MSHEKPHRRLSLTQPTAVPTAPARDESFSPEVRDLERSLRAELAAIQERMTDWDARLLRLVEALERATAQRVAVTREFQSTSQEAAIVIPRQTSLPTYTEQKRASEEPGEPVSSSASRNRKIQVLRTGQAPHEAEPELAAAASHSPEDARATGEPVRVRTVPTTHQPLDRIRIPVRDTSSGGVPSCSSTG